MTTQQTTSEALSLVGRTGPQGTRLHPMYQASPDTPAVFTCRCNGTAGGTGHAFWQGLGIPNCPDARRNARTRENDEAQASMTMSPTEARTLRKHTGKSQQEWAELLGVSHGTVRNIESCAAARYPAGRYLEAMWRMAAAQHKKR